MQERSASNRYHVVSKRDGLKSEDVRTVPASCAVLAETVEGSNDGVGDLTKHVRQVEHVWRAALNASRRFRVGVHLERKGWRSGWRDQS